MLFPHHQAVPAATPSGRVGESPSPVPAPLGISPQPTDDPTPGAGGRVLFRSTVPETVARVEETHPQGGLSAWSTGCFLVLSSDPVSEQLARKGDAGAGGVEQL